MYVCMCARMRTEGPGASGAKLLVRTELLLSPGLACLPVTSGLVVGVRGREGVVAWCWPGGDEDILGGRGGQGLRGCCGLAREGQGALHGDSLWEEEAKGVQGTGLRDSQLAKPEGPDGPRAGSSLPGPRISPPRTWDPPGGCGRPGSAVQRSVAFPLLLLFLRRACA